MADDKTQIWIVGTLIAAVTGLYGWFLTHMSNSKKHPSKDAIVYKDYCDKNHDCVEAKIDGLKELMEQRFDSLEELVRNNGQPRGRVRT